MQNRNWLIESDKKLLYSYYGCCFTIGASLLVWLCVYMCFFTLDSLLAHRIFHILISFACNFRISFFFHCVVKLMHVLPFLFLFQPGNLLLYILYLSLLPVFFFFSFVSYFIILNLLLFITALYATYHDHGTWLVRLQLSVFRMNSPIVFGDAQQGCDLF